jgi:hypothetical protein
MVCETEATLFYALILGQLAANFGREIQQHRRRSQAAVMLPVRLQQQGHPD